MSVKVTSRKFSCPDFVADSGIDTLNGCIVDKVKCVTTIDISWFIDHCKAEFNATNKTVELVDYLDNRTWSSETFSVGDTVEIEGTVANDGTLTITAISDDFRTITVAEVLLDEESEDMSAYGSTPIVAMDYRFNLIPNGNVADYNSLTDTDYEQIFFAEGLDASDTMTDLPLFAKTKSFAWVTDSLASSVTGETNNCTITGGGNVNHIQTFVITQYFFITPISTTGLYNNLKNGITPEYFTKGSALKMIQSFGMKYDEKNAIADQSGEKTDGNGTDVWFDEGQGGKRADIYIDSISYSGSLDALDVAQTMTVTIVVKSLSGAFAANQRLILGFFTSPNSTADFQNTITTLIQNIFLDRAIIDIGGSTTIDNVSTDYQVFASASAVRDSASQITITASFDAGTALTDYWESKEDNQRYYQFFVTTQTKSISDTKSTDRVITLSDIFLANWDRRDSALINFVDYGIVHYPYPNEKNMPFGDINQIEGDMGIVECNFRMKATAVMKNIKLEVVATKSGQSDFILQQTKVDCTSMVVLNGEQQISVDETIGLLTYDGDPFNAFTIERNSSDDATGYLAYLINMGLVMRFEQWITADGLEQILSQNGSTPDIAKSLSEITQRWYSYSVSPALWDLYFRITWTLNDENGNETSIYSQIPIVVSPSNSIQWSGVGLKGDYAFYFTDADAVQWRVDTILTDETTEIVITFDGGDFALPAECDNYFGTISAVIQSQGSILDRRFASSEYPSEDDSPFTAPDADPLADESWADGNVRIDIFTATAVVLRTNFDASLYNNQDIEVLVFGQIGGRYITT